MARREIRSCTGELFDASVASTRLDVVQQSLERMAGLIDGAMRDAARGLGKPGGPLQQFTLGQSVRHAVDVLAPRAAAAGIAIELAIDERAASLPTGPLYTPLLNGVRNAVDAVERASPDSERDHGIRGRVSVEVAMESSGGVPGVLARIRDTGRGLARGFDPLLASGAPRPGGLGIGLALSTTIVEHAGGWLGLANRDEGGGPGAGAVLQFWVPLASLEVSDGWRQG